MFYVSVKACCRHSSTYHDPMMCSSEFTIKTRLQTDGRPVKCQSPSVKAIPPNSVREPSIPFSKPNQGSVALGQCPETFPEGHGACDKQDIVHYSPTQSQAAIAHFQPSSICIRFVSAVIILGGGWGTQWHASLDPAPESWQSAEIAEAMSEDHGWQRTGAQEEKGSVEAEE